MKLINAEIHIDLCACALEECLNTLKSKDIDKVFLITSPRYAEFILSLITVHKFQLDDSEEKIIFPLINIDTSKALKRDSWMLIDYEKNKIYYSEGA